MSELQTRLEAGTLDPKFSMEHVDGLIKLLDEKKDDLTPVEIETLTTQLTNLKDTIKATDETLVSDHLKNINSIMETLKASVLWRMNMTKV